jgi:methionyl-tRNA synthetase
MEFDQALSEIWSIIRRANKYIDQVEPWKLFKEADKHDVLAACLYNLAEVLRITAILIEPAMPNTPPKIFAQLNVKCDNHKSWDSTAAFGTLPFDMQITKGDVIFPRIDVKR